MLSVGVLCLCPADVCFSGGGADKLYFGNSVSDPTAYDHKHIPSYMGGLAPLLWTLEPRHDCFPLLQGHQDCPWVPPYSKTTSTEPQQAN